MLLNISVSRYRFCGITKKINKFTEKISKYICLYHKKAVPLHIMHKNEYHAYYFRHHYKVD